MPSLVDTLIVQLMVKGRESLSDLDAALALNAASQEKNTQATKRSKAASAESATQDEITTKARRTTTAELLRVISANDKASMIVQKYANNMEKLRRMEEDSSHDKQLLAAAQMVVTRTMEQGLAVLDKLTKGIETYDAEVETATSHIEAFGKEVERLGAKYSPLTAAQKSNVTALDEVNRALSYGSITQKEHAVAIAQTTLAYEQQVIALHAAANAAKAAFTTESIGHILEYNQEIERLVQEYDKVGVAAAKFAKIEAEVAMVVAAGKLDQEQATRAINEAAAARDKASGKAPAAAEKVTPAVRETVGPGIAKLNADLSQLRASYDEVYAAELKLQKVQRDTDVLIGLGVGNVHEMTAALREAAAVRDQAASRAKGDPVIGQDADAHIQAYIARIEELRIKFDPLYAAESKNLALIKEINEAFDRGAIGIPRWMAQLDAAKVEFEEAVRQINTADAPKPQARPADSHVDEFIKDQERLKRAYDLVYDAEQKHKAALADIANTPFENEERRAQAVNRATNAYQNNLKAIDKVNSSNKSSIITSGQLNAAVTNLGFQFNDIATGLLSGQSPFTIIAQQGGQIIQAFTQGGGVKAVLTGFADSVKGFITPVTAAVAAIGALVVAIIALASRQANVEARARAYQVSLDIMGTSSQNTAANLELVTKALINQGVEAEKAKAAIIALAQTPGINAGAIGDISQLALNISGARGTELVAQAQSLGKAVAGTATELEKFNEELGVKYTASEKAAITAAKAHRDENAQFMVEYAALTRTYKDKNEEMKSDWAKSVQELKKSWSEFLDMFGPTSLAIVKFFFDSLKTWAQEAKGVVSTFFSGMEWLKNFTEDTANKIRTGLGLAPNAPSGAGSSAGPARDVAPRVSVTGNVLGADNPQIQKLITILDKSSTALAEGQKFQIFSAYRPGATVSGTGRSSLHADADAVDVRVVSVDNKIVNTGVVGLPSMGAGLITPAMEKQIQIVAASMGEQVSLGSTFRRPDPGHVGIGAGTWEVSSNQARQVALLGKPDASVALPDVMTTGKSPRGDTSEEAKRILEDLRQRNAILAESYGKVGRAEVEANARAQATLETVGLKIDQSEKDKIVNEKVAQALLQHDQANKVLVETEKIRVTGIQAVAEAYMGEGGEVAGLKAAAEAAAALEQRAGKTTTAQMLLTAASVEANEASAKNLPVLGLQLKQSENLVDATAKGTAAEHQAQIQNQISTATHEALAKAIASGNPALIAQATALTDATGKLIKRNDVLQQTYQLEQQINQRNNQIEVLKLTATLQFQTAEEIQRQVSLLQAKQDLEARGITAGEEIYQKTLANVDALGQQNIKLAESTKVAGTINDAIKGVATTVDTTLTDALDSVLSGKKIKSWGDTFKQTISDIAKQLISGLIVKPLIGTALSAAGFGKVGADFGSISGIFGALGGLGGGGEQTIKDKEGNITGTLSSGGGVLKDIFGGSGGSGGIFGSGNSLGGIGDFFRGGLGGTFAHPTSLQELFPSVASADLPAYASAAGNANILSGGSVTPGLFGSSATLGSAIGGVTAGFGAGMFLNNILGGNQTGGTIGSAGGAIAGAAIGSIIPGIGTLIGGLVGGAAGGGLGGLFGGTKKPDAASGGVLNLATGQIVNAQSGGNAQNDATASQIGTVLGKAVQLALAIPGAKLPGGAVAIQAGSRDGIKLSFGGMSQKFNSAEAAIAFGLNALRDNLTGVSDTVQKVIHSIGSPDQIEGALAFAQAYENLAKAVDDSFKDIETAAKTGPFEKVKQQLEAVFAGMAQQAEQFGLAVEPVNKALEEATRRLNVDFKKAVDTAFNSATGRDFLDNVQNVIDGYEQMARDASAIGADKSIHDKLGQTFVAELDNIFKTLSSTQLDEVVSQFGSLSGVLPDMAKAARDAAKAVEDLNLEMTRQAAAYQIQQDYDNAANQGFLSQLRDLDKARIESQKTAKILDLGEGRQGVIQETEHKAALNILQGLTNEELEVARKTLEGLNPLFGKWVDEVKAMTQATKDATDADARRTAILQAQLNIQQFLNQLLTAQSAFTSPLSRLQAAQDQYNALLAKAQAGDLDSLQGITAAAQTLLTSVSDYYASSEPGQAIFAQVQAQLQALLGGVGTGTATGATTQDVVTAVTDTGASTVTTINATSASLISAGITASSAITTNAIAVNAGLIDAANAANENLVNTTLQTGQDITNASLIGAASIVGGTATEFKAQTLELMTGTGTVVTATAATTTAVITSGTDIVAGTQALLDNTVANSAALIGSNTKNATDSIAANVANTITLQDAGAAQTAAMLDGNTANANTLVERNAANTNSIIDDSKAKTDVLIAKAQATTDQAVTAATSNTSAIISQSEAALQDSIATYNAGAGKIADTTAVKSDALLVSTAAKSDAAVANAQANTAALAVKHDQQMTTTTTSLQLTASTLSAKHDEAIRTTTASLQGVIDTVNAGAKWIVDTIGAGTGGVVETANNNTKYIVDTLNTGFNLTGPVVHTWLNSIYTQVGIWGKAEVDTINASIGWLSGVLNDQNNNQSAVIANWGNAIVASQSAWDNAINGTLQYWFASLSTVTSNVSTGIVQAVFAASDSIIGSTSWWSGAILGGNAQNTNWLLANNAAGANSVVAAVGGVSSGIIANEAAWLKWVGESIYNAVNSKSDQIMGRLDSVINGVNNGNNNDASWNQNLYNIMDTVNNNMVNWLHWVGDRIIDNGKWLNLLTEITIQFDEFMAGASGAQLEAMENIKNQLRKNAFGG